MLFDTASIPTVGSFSWSQAQVGSGMGTAIPDMEWKRPFSNLQGDFPSMPMDGCDPQVCGVPDKHDPVRA